MAKSVQVNITVPAFLAEGVKKAAYQYRYKNDPKTMKAYELIRDNPTTPLSQLQYQLRNKGIPRSIAGLKKIAVWCDLPYKE